MDLSILQKELEVKEEPGLASYDERLMEISSLVQNGHYEEAGVKAEEVIKEEIYDIRIIGYFIYGVFIEQGVAVLKDIFGVWRSIIEDNWDAIGPLRRKEKHVQTVLNWFMKQLLKKLEYEEDKQSPVWESWVESVSSEEVSEAIESLQNLRKSLIMKLEEAASSVVDAIGKIEQWLKSFEQTVYKEPEEEPEEEESEDAEEGEEIEGVSEEDLIEEEVPETGYRISEGVSVEGSYLLQRLLKKLKAFEILVRKGNILSASIVAKDIDNIIENFDPRDYFPDLFQKYYFLYAKEAVKISQFQRYKNSVKWKILEQLYNVDIDAFINFELDEEDFETLEEGELEESSEEEPLGEEEEEEEGLDEEDFEL